jgi:membrane protein
VWITPGGVLSTLLWVLASLALKFYVANFADYNATYGTLGGVMVVLLWFYVSGLAIVVGAELNAEIEHASPHGKAPGEKVPGQKKKIGVAAARAYRKRIEQSRRAAAKMPDTPTPQAPRTWAPSNPIDGARQPRAARSYRFLGAVAAAAACWAIWRRKKLKLTA